MKKPNFKQSFDDWILYEDNHLLVVNKPGGVLVQGDQTGDPPLVELGKEWLKNKYNKPGNVFLGVVHRLDRPTSGVLILSKTSKALSRLNEQFSSRNTGKTYWALVGGTTPDAEKHLNHYLVRNPKQNKSYAHDKEVPNSKQGKLRYRMLQTLDRYYLLEIELETGRHHQIRSQLAKEGIWIKGDLKYGAPRSNPDGGIDLHARSLQLTHPTTMEELSFTAPLPNTNIWKAVKT